MCLYFPQEYSYTISHVNGTNNGVYPPFSLSMEQFTYSYQQMETSATSKEGSHINYWMTWVPVSTRQCNLVQDPKISTQAIWDSHCCSIVFVSERHLLNIDRYQVPIFREPFAIASIINGQI